MGLAVLLGGAVLVLSGCILYPGQVFNPDQNVDNLGGARFSQQQAVPGFDTSSYELSPDTLEQFKDILRAHEIDPGDYRTPENEGCAGGVTTRVQMWFEENGDKEMIIDGCAAADGSFEQEATAFFTVIREGEGGGEAGELPNSEIVALVVTHDGREVRQIDQAEISKFVGLADAEGILWSQGTWVELEVGGVNTCDEYGIYEVTAEYSGSDVVGPVPVRPCGVDYGFNAAAGELFTEWFAESAD